MALIKLINKKLYVFLHLRLSAFISGLSVLGVGSTPNRFREPATGKSADAERFAIQRAFLRPGRRADNCGARALDGRLPVRAKPRGGRWWRW